MKSKKQTKNEIATKWERTGLLKHLRPPNKVKCAGLLEDVATLLIKKANGGKDVSPKSEMIAGTLLPIVRVLYGKKSTIKSMPTAQWLYDDYIKFIDSGHNPLDDNIPVVGYDPEKKCVDLYVKDVIGRLK